MTFHSQSLVHVYYHGSLSKQLMGRLFLKDRKIFFEYDSSFIKTGLELSPFKLPLKNDIMTEPDRIFDGLFGIFNDSLPDGWGRLLLDRTLTKLDLNPSMLSSLDRLCFVGSSGMGALSYEPENPYSDSRLPKDLDEIANEIQATLEKDDNSYVEDLLHLTSSSGGARPKILVDIDNEDWLIKFKASHDPKDIGSIEYAYHLMALDAGLNVPDAKLFPSRNGHGFFGVKRFDRNAGKRIHMHTIAGLLHADHRYPSLDYQSIMKATIYLTRDVKESESQFKNAVFNVLSHNRDDHSKNFSFLMEDCGTWRVSPAYDLTFSSGPTGEHATMIMGEGRKPTKEHLLRLAQIGNIKKEKAVSIIERTVEATKKWPDFASKAGVSQLQTKNIGGTLKRLSTTLGY